MKGRIPWTAVLALVLLLPLCAADERIDLEIDSEDSRYETGGSVDIEVTVSNPSENWDVSDVTVSATGDGLSFSYSPSSATIAKGDDESFTVTASGFIWQETEVEIRADAPGTEDYDIHGDSTTVILEPPRMGIEVLAPDTKMGVVVENTSLSQEVRFDILLKNTGEYGLEGVAVNVTYDADELSCTDATDSKDIAMGKTESFGMGCQNVDSGDQVLMTISDKHGAVKEVAGVTFEFIEEEKETGPLTPDSANASFAGRFGEVFMPPSAAGESWPMFRGNPARTGLCNGSGDLDEDFLVSWTHNLPRGAFGSPVVGELAGRGGLEVVVPLEKAQGSQTDSLMMLSVSGEPVWSFSSEYGAHSSPALADLDRDGDLDVVFGTNGGAVYALDGESGEEIWSFRKAVGTFRSSPLVYDGDGDGNIEVYIGSDGGLHAFDGMSGIPEWTYPTSKEVTSSPAIGNLDDDDGLEIAFAAQDGILYVLNEDGTLVWHLEADSKIIYSSPAIAPDKRVIIGTEGGELLFVKAGNIEETFTANAAITGSPAISGSDNYTVVFATAAETEVHGAYVKSENRIYGLDSQGEELWSVDTGGWSVFSSPALADLDRDGTVEAAVGSREGRLYVIDIESGEVEWTYSGGTGLFASPAVADADGDGNLEMVLAYRFSNQIKLLDSPDKPDLAIGNLSFSDDFPENGDVINISVSIVNRGDAPSTNATLALYTRSPVLDNPVGNTSLPGLGAGEEANASLGWEVRLPPGEVGIYAEVDPFEEIGEANELNNGFFRGFHNDLRIVSYSFPGNLGVATQETSGKALVTIENRGRLDLEDVEVILIKQLPNGTSEESRKSVDLGAGEQTELKLPLLYKPGENSTFKIAVDPGGKVKENYKGNNIIIWEPEVARPSGGSHASEEPSPSGEESTDSMLILLLLAAAVGIIIWKKVIEPKRKKGRKKGEGAEGGGEAEKGDEYKSEMPDASG